MRDAMALLGSRVARVFFVVVGIGGGSHRDHDLRPRVERSPPAARMEAAADRLHGLRFSVHGDVSGVERPNFFMIGAPKCGTTAMTQYLSEHPDVLFSSPKEAKYFHTDFDPAHRLAFTDEEYWRMFGGLSTMRAAPAVGEGTVWYLYSESAVPNILEYNPDARFLVMVRNPVELVQALHSQLVYGGDDDVQSFEQAWRLQSERERGHRIPALCRDRKSLQYGPIAKQGEQVSRLFSRVDRAAVRIGVFDDLARDPATEYRATLRFLGLPDDGRSHFPVVNPNRRIRLRSLARALAWGSRLKRRLGVRASLRLWAAFSPLVSTQSPRPPVSDALREELIDYFARDVALLSTLISRDLTHWTSRSGPQGP
jgi:hypothetical protein